MTLTLEQIEEKRFSLTTRGLDDDEEMDALCDMALAYLELKDKQRDESRKNADQRPS